MNLTGLFYFFTTSNLLFKPSSSWNESTNNDIFFETVQVVNLTGNSSIDKNFGCFLEGSGGQEALSGESNLGNTQE